MREGRLGYNSSNGRYGILLSDLWLDTGLHCGECLQVLMDGKWMQTRMENGAVIMNDEGRKVFLSAWQSKKQETIKHPFLGEKIEWGMAPYVQSLLLARFLRGDLDEYPPFFWK